MTHEDFGVGLDLATKTSGLFFSVGSALRHGEIIKAKSADEMADQILLRLQGGFLIDNAVCTPDWVAIENTFLGLNPQTKQMLDRLIGDVSGGVRRMGAKVYIGSTAQIDSVCGLVGHLKRPARKKATTALAESCGFVLPQDACDALAVNLWGRGEWRKDQWLHEPQGD
jgi:Holliday junction resolvasome RuvABC endonuclease subunit